MTSLMTADERYQSDLETVLNQKNEIGYAGLFSRLRPSLAGDPFNLKIRYEDDGRVLFKYDQIRSDMDSLVCQTARGHIYDVVTPYGEPVVAVSRPFDKFFNATERQGEQVVTAMSDDLVAEEKADGTCIALYYWRGEWVAQTLGTVEATGEVCGIHGDLYDGTFSRLFWTTMKDRHGSSALDRLDHGLTYIFELCTPWNRIVTRYDEHHVVLLGARVTRTGEEVKPIYLRSLPFPQPKRERIYDPNGAVARLADLDEEHEGFVVVDRRNRNAQGQFLRVKVKNPAWFKLSKMRDSLTATQDALYGYALDHDEEVLGYFPDLEPKYLDLKAKLDYTATWMQSHADAWTTHVYRQVWSRKDYAGAVGSSWYKGPLRGIMFALLDGKVASARDGLRQVSPKAVIPFLLNPDNPFDG